MSKDIALDTIGTKDLPAGPYRDAVHVAVVSAVAGEDLVAGDHVGFADPTTDIATKIAKVKVGVVDCYLEVPVARGERFWLMVYPRRIIGLHHVWEHRQIPAVLLDGSELVQNIILAEKRIAEKEEEDEGYYQCCPEEDEYRCCPEEGY